MGNEQRIIDKILSDAKEAADKTVGEAKAEVDKMLSNVKEKLEKEEKAALLKDEEAAKNAGAKEISKAQSEAKRKILSAKQEILAETLRMAQDKMLHFTDEEYVAFLEEMLKGVQIGEDCEIILCPKDKERVLPWLEKKNLKLSSENGDFSGGFIIKDGDIEYNYSFEAIMAVEKEQMEQTAAEILFR